MGTCFKPKKRSTCADKHRFLFSQNLMQLRLFNRKRFCKTLSVFWFAVCRTQINRSLLNVSIWLNQKTFNLHRQTSVFVFTKLDAVAFVQQKKVLQGVELFLVCCLSDSDQPLLVERINLVKQKLVQLAQTSIGFCFHKTRCSRICSTEKRFARRWTFFGLLSVGLRSTAACWTYQFS